MSALKLNRKEIQQRLKKTIEKLLTPKKDRAVPQMILQPVRNRKPWQTS
jgi:hypothetical protein